VTGAPAEREPSPPVHGGDLRAIGRRYGIDPDTLLDFSVNINPAGPPPALLRALEAGARDVAALARYPESDARSLRLALAAQLDIEPDAIVVANGAAALLGTSLAALAARRCVGPTPAFSEYRHAVRSAGARWFGVALDPAADFALDAARLCAAVRTSAADACIIANPHNPSGSLTPPQTLLALAADIAPRETAVVVDEAFIDYAPASSITRSAPKSANIIVVRSLTKFYGVPGLRAGYAVTNPDLGRTLRAQLPSWPVTSLAIDAFTAALGDRAYARKTLTDNAAARALLVRELATLGLHVAPSAANFLLVALPPGAPPATELTRRLIVQERIVVRDCSSYEGLSSGSYIRVGVRRPPENERLTQALARTLGRNPAPQASV
jgi:threonine-phosphate decarboxylase